MCLLFAAAVSDEAFVVLGLQPGALDGICGVVHCPEEFEDV